jgi:hypothetical protein
MWEALMACRNQAMYEHTTTEMATVYANPPAT